MSRRISRHNLPDSSGSSFEVALKLCKSVIDWDVLADPRMAGPIANVDREFGRHSRTGRLRIAAQLLVIIRALAYELPAERRAQVLDELTALL